jgi:hypothetical protein
MTTYKRLLTTPNINDIKALYGALQNLPLDDLRVCSAKEVLDTSLSVSLNIANPDSFCSQRFNIALDKLALSPYDFAKAFKLDGAFTKRLTFVNHLNPRLVTLTPWLDHKTSSSVLIYVFFPLVHNRLLITF